MVCGNPTREGCLCETCQSGFKKFVPPYCDRCGEPLPPNRILCRRCSAAIDVPFAWSYAPYQYDGTMLRAIHRLKYDRRSALAKPLGLLFANCLPECAPLTEQREFERAFDAVLPVPLHTSRLRTRGFNQAELLAREVCDITGWHLDTTLLARVRPTPTQTAMSAEERSANVRGAFVLQRPLAVVHKQLLVLDDVLTSTATAREIARVLKDAGADRVCVAALARSA
jgi:competence protein ComFC